MTKKDLISRIKTQLKSLIQPDIQMFAEAKAGELMITTPDENFQIGSEVFYVDSDGNNAPLNEGEYTLDNGVKFKVMGGKIVEMSSGEEEMAPEDLTAETEPVKQEELADTGIDMVEYGQIKERLAKCEYMIDKMMKEKEKMEAEFKAFAGQPLENQIKSNPTANQPVSMKKDEVSIDNIMDIRKRARKNYR